MNRSIRSKWEEAGFMEPSGEGKPLQAFDQALLNYKKLAKEIESFKVSNPVLAQTKREEADRLARMIRSNPLFRPEDELELFLPEIDQTDPNKRLNEILVRVDEIKSWLKDRDNPPNEKQSMVLE